jgi:hypothetical protein
MLARFDVFSVTAQAIVVPKGLVYERPQVAEVDYIDKAVNEQTAPPAHRALRDLYRRGVRPPRLHRRHRPLPEAG